MQIRPPRYYDLREINRIYDTYFKDNEYPDFLDEKSFPCPFVVARDGDDKVIVAGGVKLIAEAVVLTDRALDRKVRLDALLQALGSSMFVAQGMKHKKIYAFVNNDTSYTRILQKFGFKLQDVKVLCLDFGEPDGS